MISLMTRVNALPRLESAAAFLCLMVCHLEWPDMLENPKKSTRWGRKTLHLFRQHDRQSARSSQGRPR